MRVPVATYRLQLNADFKLSQILELLDYFAVLGVSDLYLSPLLQAQPGSTHGYDVTEPGRVNAEIGSDHDLQQLAHELHARGMSILLDIVPNHMAATEANPWWCDVLRHGPASAYANYFEIDWSADPPGAGRIMLPILGQELDDCIDSQDLRVAVAAEGPAIAYADRRLPVDPATVPFLVDAIIRTHPDRIDASVRQTLEAAAAAGRMIPDRTDLTRSAERAPGAAQVEQHFQSAAASLVSCFGESVPLPRSVVHALIDRQVYALSFWVTGARHLNYRRFFDIADLVGVRIERPEVFRAVHERVIGWLADGTIAGVRIDHIDGLRDPRGYLERLHTMAREAAALERYMVVEKILVGAETLPSRWCTAGTTGYEFAAALNGLFIQPEGWHTLTDFYRQVTGITAFDRLVYEKKKLVMQRLFSSEMRSLAERLSVLLNVDPQSAEDALSEVTASLPVYRTYCTGGEASEVDRAHLNQALSAARAHGLPQATSAALRQILLEPIQADQHEFVQRWQQFSGPVMAKGLEDTALYHYNALISVCDVGADPRFALTSINEFHARMRERQASWPATLNATSTHDSKRAEDVRARINVLSELADDWVAAASRWLERDAASGISALPPAEALLLYQTLLGAWPLNGAEPGFADRLRKFLIKALRETKNRTSWLNPNEMVEAAALEFVDRLLSDRQFDDELRPLEARTSFYGALNALSQLVIKIGAPGVPDFYQGTELWSLALVDPDNRRPVDYAFRKSLSECPESLSEMRDHWRDGRIKLSIMRRGLAARRAFPELFVRGHYLPLPVSGDRARNLIAFERRLDDQRIVVLAARFFSELSPDLGWPGSDAWGDTLVPLGRGKWENLLTDATFDSTGNVRAAHLLHALPVAVIASR